MPIQYLEGNNENQYAIKRLGSTFSDAILNMAEAKAKGRQMQHNAMIDNAYLQLQQAKDKSATALNEKKSGVIDNTMQQTKRIQRLKSQSQMGPGVMELVKDPKAGPQMMDDLRQSGVMPDGATQLSGDELLRRMAMAVSGQVYGEAASNPAGAASLMRPQNSAPNATVVDPSNPTAAPRVNPPAQVSPYQQQGLDLRQKQAQQQEIAKQALMKLGIQKYQELKRHNQAMEGRATGGGGNPLDARLRQSLGAGFGQTAPQQQPQGQGQPKLSPGQKVQQDGITYLVDENGTPQPVQ